jgi:tetratricopeptide (TPR) repeat protein
MSAKARQFMERLFNGTDSLTRQLTVAEAEAEHAVRVKELGRSFPFGYLNPEWNKLKAKMRDGDELWEFRLKGMNRRHRGVKLVRNGKVIGCIVAEVLEIKPPPAPKYGRRNDPWNLIEAGKYQQAVRAFSARLRRDKSGFNYGGRAFAYLNLGEYDKALADFRAADAADDNCDSYLKSAGVAQWLAGRESESSCTWLDAVRAHLRGKIRYSDGAGGVESGCLVCLSEDQLRSEVAPEPIVHECESCQAEFYIGVRRLQLGDHVGAKRAFRNAARFPAAKHENEYYLAMHESKRSLRKIRSRDSSA